MSPISLAALLEQKVRRTENPPTCKQLLLHLTDRAHGAIDWGMRHAITPADEAVAWQLDSALGELEQACALMRRRIAQARFEEAA
jgi:hypothetical protein